MDWLFLPPYLSLPLAESITQVLHSEEQEEEMSTGEQSKHSILLCCFCPLSGINTPTWRDFKRPTYLWSWQEQALKNQYEPVPTIIGKKEKEVWESLSPLPPPSTPLSFLSSVP